MRPCAGGNSANDCTSNTQVRTGITRVNEKEDEIFVKKNGYKMRRGPRINTPDTTCSLGRRRIDVRLALWTYFHINPENRFSELDRNMMLVKRVEMEEDKDAGTDHTMAGRSPIAVVRTRFDCRSFCLGGCAAIAKFV